MIPALPRPVRSYLLSFSIACVCTFPSGRIAVRRDPCGATSAWWCDADLAGDLAREARKNGGDIVGAAQRLGIQLTPHASVLARATACTERIKGGLAELQERGGLKYFNKVYRERRQAAAVRGESFMPYAAARARLRQAIGGVAAGETSSIIARVFER